MLKSVLVVGASVAALAGIGVVAGVPMVHGWLDERHEQEGTYPTGKEAKADRVAMPVWLPDGAIDVHFKFRTTDGNRILTAARCRTASCPGVRADFGAPPAGAHRIVVPAGRGAQRDRALRKILGLHREEHVVRVAAGPRRGQRARGRTGPPALTVSRGG
ncbi:hypothetical protein ACU686_04430 [Yinghuangia aomiensis]